MKKEKQVSYSWPTPSDGMPAADPGPTVNLRASVRVIEHGSLEVGDFLENCRLVARLGYGSSGQTFLARETALADRPIVLKVATDNHDEHMNLARLQHTHIMPLFWARSLFPDGVRILAMPYLAKTTLASLLSRLQGLPLQRWDGTRVFEVLQEDQEGLPIQIPADEATANVLKESTWVTFVVRLGRALAEALAFAHQRNLLHLDIKPANIVLTPDGQPLLLDLDVARPPLAAGDTAVPWLGGTPAYMSPEQKAAMHALKRDLPIPAPVDGRTDLYSLALVLYQALGGVCDCANRPDPLQLPRMNPSVSRELAAILARCLADNPDDRYADCAALAEDLDRYQRDRPLRGVRTSLVERWQKWRRRQPYGLPIAGLLVGFCAAAGLACYNLHQMHVERNAQVEAALYEGHEWQRKGQHEAAARRFATCKKLAAEANVNGPLREHVERRLHAAQRLQAASELSKTVQMMRFHALQEKAPRRLEHVLEATARNTWAMRGVLRDQLAGKLEPATEKDIDSQLQELVLLWSDLQMRLAPASHKEPVRAEVRKVIEQADELFGPSFALQLARAQADCGSLPAERAQAQAGWELCAVGRAALRKGDLATAVRNFEQALEHDPLDHVANLHMSVGLLRQKKYAQAMTGLSYCVGKDPSPECLLLRGEALAGMGKLDEALRDFNLAVEKNAGYAAVYEHRGNLLLQLGRPEESVKDQELARTLHD